MIELLSRLSPATSRLLAQMQDDGADTRHSVDEMEQARKERRSGRCPTCRGKKRVPKPAVLGEKNREYEVCPACEGSGKRPQTHGKATRAKGPPEVMTPEQIAFTTAGMAPHVLRAAILHVTHDGLTRRFVVRDVSERIVSRGAERWGLPEPVVPIRVLGLSRVTALGLMLRQEQQVPREMAADLMCVVPGEWDRTWAERAHETTAQARGWIDRADDHMNRRRREREEGEAA